MAQRDARVNRWMDCSTKTLSEGKKLVLDFCSSFPDPSIPPSLIPSAQPTSACMAPPSLIPQSALFPPSLPSSFHPSNPKTTPFLPFFLSSGRRRRTLEISRHNDVDGTELKCIRLKVVWRKDDVKQNLLELLFLQHKNPKVLAKT